jgi:hypothetical protein
LTCSSTDALASPLTSFLGFPAFPSRFWINQVSLSKF